MARHMKRSRAGVARAIVTGELFMPDQGTLTKLGLTAEEYADMLKIQGGRCAVCLCLFTGKHYKPYIDRNLKTGKVRGLLCASCDTGLSRLGDSVAGLRRAANYLLKHGEPME